MTELEVIQIAKVCHEANRAWCEANGDFSQSVWKDAPENIKQSAIAGVEFHIDNPDADAEASHNEWFLFKQKDGWGYGDVKDAVKKTHPCMVPYESLSVVEQKKDFLFKSIVNALKGNN